MATSPNDPRIKQAIRTAVETMQSYNGRIDSRGSFVWREVYPAGDGWAWCGAFQVFGYRRAGVDLMKCCWWFYTPYIVRFAKKIGAWRQESGYGRQCLMDWQGNGIANHVGTSIPDPNSRYFRNIEGNTSGGTRGSQRMGGGVHVRYRPRGVILGWVDMHVVLAWMIDNGKWHPGGAGVSVHAAASATNPNGYSPNYVRDVQRKLQAAGYSVGSAGIDGSLGWDTYGAVVRFQKDHGLDPDGIPGPKTMAKLSAKSAKSADIRDLQRAVRAVPDNLPGPDTRKRINAVRQSSQWGGHKFPYGVAYAQRVVGTNPDGSWGPDSIRCHDRTVLAIQRAVGADQDAMYGPRTDALVRAALAAAERN